MASNRWPTRDEARDLLFEFTAHDGFDGVMLGHKAAAYHLEFTRTHKAGHRAGRAPTQENLLVFYLPDPDDWRRAVARLERHGYAAVPSFIRIGQWSLSCMTA